MGQENCGKAAMMANQKQDAKLLMMANSYVAESGLASEDLETRTSNVWSNWEAEPHKVNLTRLKGQTFLPKLLFCDGYFRYRRSFRF